MGSVMRKVIEQTRIISVPVLVLICALLYVGAFIAERLTGIATIPRMLALSDTAQVYLVAAALCIVLAINLALPFDVVTGLTKTVATIAVDALWFTLSALTVAAIYVALVDGTIVVLTQLLPIIFFALVGIVAGAWVWSELLNAKPGAISRALLAVILIGFAFYFVYSLPATSPN